MTIETYVCSACTTGSIASLGTQKDAKSAMLNFCKSQLISAPNRFDPPDASRFQTLISFYIFTAGPEEKGHGHSQPWVKYGTEFAAYIRKNKLGKIATCPAKLNLKHHPKTTCQTWLWSPDQEAMEAWWTKQTTEKPKAKKVAKTAPPKKVGRPPYPDLDHVCPRCNETYGVHSGWRCLDGGTWPE